MFFHVVLCPHPTIRKGEGGLMNLDHFLGLNWPARLACADTPVLKQALDLIGHGYRSMIQIYTACNGASHDCTKAAISLERSNSFPWAKDCVQIRQTPFPSQWVGSEHDSFL